MGKLIALCTEKLADQPKLLSSVLHMLTEVIDDGVQTIKLTEASLTAEADPDDTNGNAAGSLEDMPIDKLIPILSKLVINEAKAKSSKSNGLSTRYKSNDNQRRSDGLPNSIVSRCTPGNNRAKTDTDLPILTTLVSSRAMPTRRGISTQRYLPMHRGRGELETIELHAIFVRSCIHTEAASLHARSYDVREEGHCYRIPWPRFPSSVTAKLV